MLDFVTEWISSSPWTYGIVAGLVVLDFTAVIPAETVIIAATIIALGGDLSVWLLYPSVVVGALIGDQILYFLGAKVGDPVLDKIFTSRRQRERLEWAEERMQEHGRVAIIAIRFIPVGRTATIFGAGALEMPWRRFIVADVIAVLLYSAYVIALGWFGGQAFQDSLWKPFLVSAAIGVVIAAVAEGIRRLYERRRGDD